MIRKEEDEDICFRLFPQNTLVAKKFREKVYRNFFLFGFL